MSYNFIQSVDKKTKTDVGVKGIQNVSTPIDSIEKLVGFQFSSYITENTKNILVLFNIEFVDYLAKFFTNNGIYDKTIYVFLDSSYDYNILVHNIECPNMYKNQKIVILNKNDYFITKKNVVEKLNRYLNMKHFDIIFSNPPYGDSSDTALDLKICEEAFKCSDEMIILQPAGWIDADSNTGKSKTWSKKLGKYIKSVYFLDLNSIMDIKLKTHGAIVYYTKNKIENIIVKDFIKNEEFIADTIYNITKYGKMWLNSVKEFKDYIESNFSDFMPAHAATSATSDFSIRFSRWCGHVGKPDFYSPINITGVEKQFVEKSYVTEFTGAKCNEPAYIVFSFSTDNERQNFVNYWKSKVTRFILSFYKHNINFTHGKPYRIIPWMDFTQEWNDKKLCEEFGISEELWNYIDNFIPDYYSDYKSGF
jgi:hypothetical protein